MKKARKHIRLLAICSMCIAMLSTCAGSFAVTASALSDTVTQDGLEVSLSTDKESYGTDDPITATLKVTNKNQYDVPNVGLENYVPNGYRLADGNSATLTAQNLAAGESVSLTVTLVYEPETTEVVVTVAAFTDTSTTTETTETTATGNGTQTTVSTGTSGTKASGTNNTAGSLKTGDTSTYISAAALIGMLAFAVAVLVKKKRKSMLSLILCLAVLPAVKNELRVSAVTDAPTGDFVTVSLTVPVGNSTLVLDGIVTYDYPASEHEEISQDDYYTQNAEKVIAVRNAAESENTLSEKEALALLVDKGFNKVKLTYSYLIDGTRVSEAEASADSDTKHPMYTGTFSKAGSELWGLFVIEGSVFASPISYNFSSGRPEVLFSESDSLISYANENNSFYVTIPKADSVNLKKIDTISADTLSQITREDIES